MDQHIIAFETSSRTCDVALLSVLQGQERLLTLSHDETSEHAERVLPMVGQLLGQAGIRRTDLSAVAFGQGPGGFTGLRVACGVAQGMAFALNLPVVPVPSLLAAAASDTHHDLIRVVVQDARMNEVYVSAFRVGRDRPEALSAVVDACLVGVDDFSVWLGQVARQWQAADQSGPVAIVGDALVAYPGLVGQSVITLADGTRPLRLGDPVRATASQVARLARGLLGSGGAVAASSAAPLYVRDKVAFTTHEREQGQGGNPKAQSAVDIVPMAPVHLDAVAGLEARVQSHPWTRGNFADALEAGYSAWVALREGQVTGFCVVQLAPDVAHVLVIAVAPDSQRGGLGYRLLRQAESVARQHGLPALLLEVRPSNRPAVAFYTNRGFSQIGVRKGYYPAGHGQREDALVLQKDLDRSVP
ncbi:MAG: tRNA (adenosine(37)-N6)-threonylcarbamoyltransferase complex dimerization subunit type 1 TsaB [Pusillimonas sp.]